MELLFFWTSGEKESIWQCMMRLSHKHKVRSTYHSFHKITNEWGFFWACLCNKCLIVHFLSTKNLIWSCYDFAQCYSFLVSYCSFGSAPYMVCFITMHNHLIRTKFWSEFHVESTLPTKTLLKKEKLQLQFACEEKGQGVPPLFYAFRREGIMYL